MKTETFLVTTPLGVGQVWGIDKGKVIVEMDYSYLVEFDEAEVTPMADSQSFFSDANLKAMLLAGKTPAENERLKAIFEFLRTGRIANSE